MNKKIVLLVVAFECVFSILLVSVFGPMVEAIHPRVIVTDIYFTDEDGERLENLEVIVLEEGARSYHVSWNVEAKDATNRRAELVSDLSTEELQITPDADGFGAIVMFRKKKTAQLTIRATDGSGKTATLILMPHTVIDPPDIGF